MLRITLSRIRIFFLLLGCAILGASLFDWAQGLRADEAGYAWVKADPPVAPAVETAEIWQVSASCVRPFFVNAVLQSEIKLDNHYALAPADVRAWHSRPTGENLPLAAENRDGLYRLVNGGEGGRRQNPAELERGAMLHARYAEWYADLFKLEIQKHDWELRLGNVADQSVTVSEATRRSFGAYSGRDGEHAAAKGDFDNYLLVLLGLGGFSGDQEEALRADCVKLIPIEKIFKSPNYLAEIWRWPVDDAAAFSFGLELALLGIFFVPIDLWLGTGDAAAVRRHLGDALRRLIGKIGRFSKRLAIKLLYLTRTILNGARVILTARTNAGLAVGEPRFVSKLAEMRWPRRRWYVRSHVSAFDAGKTMAAKAVEWLKRAGTNKFDDRFA
jgi:hypothetical protein